MNFTAPNIYPRPFLLSIDNFREHIKMAAILPARSCFQSLRLIARTSPATIRRLSTLPNNEHIVCLPINRMLPFTDHITVCPRAARWILETIRPVLPFQSASKSILSDWHHNSNTSNYRISQGECGLLRDCAPCHPRACSTRSRRSGTGTDVCIPSRILFGQRRRLLPTTSAAKAQAEGSQ